MADSAPLIEKGKSDEEVEKRLKDILSISAECIRIDELRELLKTEDNIVCYDGFEPSGRMHLAQAVLKSHIVRTLTKNGCHFILWVADWFAKMNHKSGGDMKKIHRLGEYFIEVWKACGIEANGNVEFLWASEVIGKNPQYWELVMDIAQTFTVSRMTRCSQIMGRSDESSLSGSQILYPCMQCADIFNLGAHICQLGMDQRKVNVLAREYGDAKGKKKPIILSHNMLMGLAEGQAKMSKSNPMSAIFVDDDPETVTLKIMSAYFPEGTIEESPLFNWLHFLVLPVMGHMKIGETDYHTFEEVTAAVEAKTFEWGALKPAMAEAINKMLDPVRAHFQSTPELRQLKKDVERIAEENAALREAELKAAAEEKKKESEEGKAKEEEQSSSSSVPSK
ncbi:putative tyrosyl-tRNA synthetase [Monocercomonoides exilis]|uniref:putative tyrosyl-tRNA synthetase n=1 Tax=Monocercomonoides exilis TaxID=2049356 RepID=UPI00355A158E|nr:putative tyrosyl-tRNA synthetase [Monocercomonoides exilis]|eukprot:MONOS_11019.1-p1 / transcript=MONOS_11019.1 / gene=MONOS_11019 / organism=Monocercomonoides_exilis_PA203 / gene_product=tyrosyl-tRNA synthetase / transcript_product=tyrosyl-tRNA synthetase / location=Mono_scaffold00528:42150-44164(-) / protein_length=394 / sequence_SO=supercontig / SO=protein_coding / is_pseudo=false